jgi:hypothetical protein
MKKSTRKKSRRSRRERGLPPRHRQSAPQDQIASAVVPIQDDPVALKRRTSPLKWAGLALTTVVALILLYLLIFPQLVDLMRTVYQINFNRR